MDLSDLIARNAAFTPGKQALRFAGGALSYAELAARIAATASALRGEFGVRRGDRVAILASNHPDYLVLLYACARIGALLVPLNWRLAAPEMQFILNDCGAKLLALEAAFAAGVPEAASMPRLGLDHAPAHGLALADAIAGGGDARDAAVDWAAPLLIVYTSGTTGRPKGAVLTQQALLGNAAMSQHMHDMTAADHVLTVLPLFHVGGLNIQTTPALQCGATLTLHARFDPATTLQAIAADRPTLTVLVPATIRALLEHPFWPRTDLTCLRAVTTGSSIVPQRLVDAVTARGVTVLQVYGATETGPIAVYTRSGGDAAPTGSTGLPGLLCEARVVDDAGAEVPAGSAGEIVVRGPNVMTGYWRDPAATAAALQGGWFHTGDLGRRDADGHFHVADRKKNMIKSGGESIYPAEIERVLLLHAAVAEAAVVGAPDPRWQEVPVAFIVRRAAQDVSAEDLHAFLDGQLARFKLPRRFVFVDDLPRSALGKVQHFRLKQDFARDSSPSGR